MEDLVPVQDNSPTPVVQVVILHGAAIVNMFRPDFADIFIFTIQVFLQYITSQLHRVSRLVVWDENIADSSKAVKHEQGEGNVSADAFLCIDSNKREFFIFGS